MMIMMLNCNYDDGNDDDDTINLASCVIVLLKEMYLNSFTLNASTSEQWQHHHFDFCLFVSLHKNTFYSNASTLELCQEHNYFPLSHKL